MTIPADLRSAQRRLARRRLAALVALRRATDERGHASWADRVVFLRDDGAVVDPVGADDRPALRNVWSA